MKYRITMKKPLISIIIPVFNGEKYVARCYESIRNQTYNNLDIIFINDGSQDNSLDFCNRISILDSRVRVINQESRGVSYTRSRGIKESKGEFISFIDVDDYVSKDFIESMYDVISQRDADCSIIDYYIDNHNTITTESANDDAEKVYNCSNAINSIFIPSGLTGYLWNKLFKKSIIDAHNIKFNERVSVWEDMLFCLEYFSYCNIIVHKNSAKYYYVQNQTSLVHKPESLIEDSKFYALNAMVEVLDSKNIECNICEKLFCEYCLKMYYHGENISREKVVDSLKKYNPKLSNKHKVLNFIIKYLPLLDKIIILYGKKMKYEKNRNFYNSNAQLWQ